MTSGYRHKHLASQADEIAPDGSQVRLLVSTSRGSMAHFTIPAGHTIRAVKHRTVDEIWYIVSGRGQMWRSLDDTENVTDLSANLAVSIPVGTTFQVRNPGAKDICVVGQTMPAWPGNDDAIVCDGPWTPTID
jgi:mannose-6-phosphate isomerase-like protein (cupin superfamily)